MTHRPAKKNLARILEGKSVVVSPADDVPIIATLRSVQRFEGMAGIPAQDVILNYLLAKHQGDGQSRGTLVWVTGLGSNALVDFEIIERLAAAGYDVLAFDPLGSGDSDWLKNSCGNTLQYKDLENPLDSCLPITAVYARLINEVNQHLGGLPVFITGHSFGAFTAHTLASAVCPTSVENLAGMVSFCGFVSSGKPYKPSAYVPLMAKSPSLYGLRFVPEFLATWIESLGVRAVVRKFASAGSSRLARRQIVMRTVYPFTRDDRSRSFRDERVKARIFYAKMVMDSISTDKSLRAMQDMQEKIHVPAVAYYSPNDTIHPAQDFVPVLQSHPNPSFVGRIIQDTFRGHLFPQEDTAATCEMILAEIERP